MEIICGLFLASKIDYINTINNEYRNPFKMGPREFKPFKADSALYTRLKKRLAPPTKRAEYKEPSYYNSKANEFTKKLNLYERDSKGNLILTDSEKALAQALYDETGPKGTIQDIMLTLKFLKDRLKDPLSGYHKSMSALINSSDSGLAKPYSGSYLTANNKHKDLVDQISLGYHRG